jgi:signal transduction histidine kinase
VREEEVALRLFGPDLKRALPAALVDALRPRRRSAGQWLPDQSLDRRAAQTAADRRRSAHEARLASAASAEALQRRLARMAFDVHDGPMQDLTAIGYRVRTLQSRVAKLVGGARAADVSLETDFEELTNQLLGAEKTLRSMMFSLEENAAAQASLLAIVDAHVERFSQHASAAVEVIANGDLELHTDSQRIVVERVLQESLSNIAKHAGAENVTIRLSEIENSLRLEVSDDGRGFDPDACGRIGTAHIGLEGMRERLQLIGGTLRVESRIGGPTTITAELEKWQSAASDTTEPTPQESDSKSSTLAA